jgi:DNA-binding transcriptional ArsR family regulator
VPTSSAFPSSALPARAALFAALGDEQRLALVRKLCASGPSSLNRLSDGSEITRQGVAKHLRVLAAAGLVSCTQRGRESIWALTPARMQTAQRALAQISSEWDAALLRLRNFVE